MVTKYLTKYLSISIEVVQVLGETDKFVKVETTLGRHIRELKAGEFRQYHDSWKDAHNFLLSEAVERVRSTSAEYLEAQKILELVKNLTEELTA